MKKKLELKLGDKIKIVKIDNIKDDDETLDCSPLLNQEGIIRCFEGEKNEMIGIDLGQSFIGITHTLNGILVKPTGIFIEEKDLKVIFSYTNDDKNKEKFVELMLVGHFKSLEDRPRKIKDVTDNVTYCQDKIKSYHKDIEINEKELIKFNKSLKLLTEEDDKEFDYSTYEKLFDKIKKHSKIDGFKFDDNHFIVTTKDLTYHETKIGERSVPDFNLGAFKIFIPVDPNSSIKACNIKRQILKTRLHHPCIKEFGICMGDSVQREVRKLRDEGSIAQTIYLLISFLEQPNYNGPYIRAGYFQFAQPVTVTMKKELDWINTSKWSDETFNDSLFQRKKDVWDSGANLEVINEMQST